MIHDIPSKDVRELATAIAKALPIVPFEHQLWTAKETAGYLKVSPKTIVDRYSHLDGFPEGRKLPSQGKNGMTRWRAMDVVEWYAKQPTINS